LTSVISSSPRLDGFWGDAGESIDAYYLVNDFVRGRRSG